MENKGIPKQMGPTEARLQEEIDGLKKRVEGLEQTDHKIEVLRDDFQKLESLIQTEIKNFNSRVDSLEDELKKGHECTNAKETRHGQGEVQEDQKAL